MAERRITERGSRYIDFVIPGLLGMNLMGNGIWGIGFAIVDSRSKRLLKRLMATPMSRSEFLMSFLLSRLFFLVLEVLALVGFGALGLLIAARAKTIEGVSGLMNLVMLPMWIFSGVFFSSSNFPDVVQPLIKILPLTAANDALRANMLEGAALKLFRWR